MQFFTQLLVLFLTTLVQHTWAHQESPRTPSPRLFRVPPQARSASVGIFARSPNAAPVPPNRLSAATANTLRLTRDPDTCHQHDRNVCAELIIGDATVNQQVRLDDDGCTPIKNAPDVTAINVFDCSCSLWSAADETACNNGDDEVVAEFNTCAGLKKRSVFASKATATYISCFRLT